MAEVITLPEESIRLGGFYVPAFKVVVKGRNLPNSELPEHVVQDILQLTYKDSVERIDSFDITLNNSYSTNTEFSIAQFKYIGSETAGGKNNSDGSSASTSNRSSNINQLARLFEPCDKEVEIYMGYMGKLELMMTGVFTTMEPNFPSGGASTLTVRGLNVLHNLRRKQYTYSWVKKRDSEIAKNIGNLKDRNTGKKRFPLEIKIDDNATQDEEPIDYVSQRNQYDVDFLLMRARRRGYKIFIKESNENGKVKKELHFVRSSSIQQELAIELEWGTSLMDFKPTLTTANQIVSVTVNGWNRRRKKPIVAKVSLKDRRLKKNQDLHKILTECAHREEIVVDEPVFTKKQAERIALDILRERQAEMIIASGTTVGLPNLRAGRQMIIKGLGSRLNGIYFITETTHTINNNGYITKFKARREDELKENKK